MIGDKETKSGIECLSDSSVVADVVCKDGMFIMTTKCPMRVIGTGICNGGEKKGIRHLFNTTIDRSVTSEKDLPGGSWYRFMELRAQSVSPEKERVCGLSTAAAMKNTSIRRIDAGGVEVVAAATAGVDVNGGRAGDPASYAEKDGEFFAAGTVNIFVIIGAILPPGSLAKAIITATEAKTSVLWELAVPSRYSSGPATGSGTDGIIVAAPDFEADDKTTAFPRMTDTGHHAVLGEAVARAVREAVREALFLETGLSAERQRNVWRRLERFGITKDTAGIPDKMPDGRPIGDPFENDGGCVALISAILHLKDETDWGLLTPEDAQRAFYGMRPDVSEHGGRLSFGETFREDMIRFLKDGRLRP